MLPLFSWANEPEGPDTKIKKHYLAGRNDYRNSCLKRFNSYTVKCNIVYVLQAVAKTSLFYGSDRILYTVFQWCIINSLDSILSNNSY